MLFDLFQSFFFPFALRKGIETSKWLYVILFSWVMFICISVLKQWFLILNYVYNIFLIIFCGFSVVDVYLESFHNRAPLTHFYNLVSYRISAGYSVAIILCSTSVKNHCDFVQNKVSFNCYLNFVFNPPPPPIILEF